MELEDLIMEKDRELIKDYIAHLNSKDNDLCKAIVYFLSKDSLDELVIRRKLFILKVLKESTHAGRFQVATFPDEIEKKLILAYNEEKQKEIDAEKAHIAELVEEMNNLF